MGLIRATWGTMGHCSELFPTQRNGLPLWAPGPQGWGSMLSEDTTRIGGAPTVRNWQT